MDVALTEEQRMLQESAEAFVRRELPLEEVRRLAEAGEGMPEEVWAKLAEQGWLGLLVPEDLGGFGLGLTELGLVCEALGKGLVPGGFQSTVLAAHALTLGEEPAPREAWLPKVVEGEARGALALLEQTGRLPQGGDSFSTTAFPHTEGFVLTGKKFLVEEAEGAHFFVVLAEVEGGGVGLFVVDRESEGLEILPNRLTDLTKRSAQVVFDGVRLGLDSKIAGTEESAIILAKVFDAANVMIAADSLAGAETVHKMTIEYAKERAQFGKPIGSFQAVKHPLADLFAELESARSAYHYAAWALDADAPDARTACALARLSANEAYRNTTHICLQLHGGIAFTWEYDLHLYLKRARHNLNLCGTPEEWEETLAAEALGI